MIEIPLHGLEGRRLSMSLPAKFFGMVGFEPTTTGIQNQDSARLSYTPYYINY